MGNKNFKELANELIVPNYATGVYIAQVLNELEKIIYTVDNKMFHYKRMDGNAQNINIVFVPEENMNSLDGITILQTVTIDMKNVQTIEKVFPESFQLEDHHLEKSHLENNCFKNNPRQNNPIKNNDMKNDLIQTNTGQNNPRQNNPGQNNDMKNDLIQNNTGQNNTRQNNAVKNEYVESDYAKHYPDFFQTEVAYNKALPRGDFQFESLEEFCKVAPEKYDYKIANNYFDIIQMIKAYGSKNIAIEKNYFYKTLAMLKVAGFTFHYTFETSFKKSREGIIWNLIFQLLNKPYPVDLFFQLLSFKRDKNYGNLRPFPYIQYSPEYKSNQFVAELEFLTKKTAEDARFFITLFELIAGFTPIWKPGMNHVANQEFLSQAIMIEQEGSYNLAEYNLIDKSLAPYFENVIYIGDFPNEGTDLHILPNFSVHQGEVWPKNEIRAEINTAREQKFALSGSFGQLKASNLGVLYEEANLHGVLRSYVIQEIAFKLSKNGMINGVEHGWKQWLISSGIEYIKLLHRCNMLIQIFFKWFEKIGQENYLVEYAFSNNVSSPKGDHNNSLLLKADFWAVNKFGKLIIAKIVLNTPIEEQIYKKDVQLAMFANIPDVDDVYVISPDKYIKLDLNQPFYAADHLEIEMDNIKITNNWAKIGEGKKVILPEFKLTKFDDLFYWNL